MNPNNQASSAATKKMSITLPPKTARMLKLLSDTEAVSQNEVVKRAIATEAIIQREVQNDSKIIIETAQGERKELIFR